MDDNKEKDNKKEELVNTANKVIDDLMSINAVDEAKQAQDKLNKFEAIEQAKTKKKVELVEEATKAIDGLIALNSMLKEERDQNITAEVSEKEDNT